MSPLGVLFFKVVACTRRIAVAVEWLLSDLRRRSSMAEHLFCKQVVAGSTPVAGSISSPHAPVSLHCPMV